eukprot:2451377-Rhodomonas_salina.1
MADCISRVITSSETTSPPISSFFPIMSQSSTLARNAPAPAPGTLNVRTNHRFLEPRHLTSNPEISQQIETSHTTSRHLPAAKFPDIAQQMRTHLASNSRRDRRARRSGTCSGIEHVEDIPLVPVWVVGTLVEPYATSVPGTGSR